MVSAQVQIFEQNHFCRPKTLPEITWFFRGSEHVRNWWHQNPATARCRDCPWGPQTELRPLRASPCSCQLTPNVFQLKFGSTILHLLKNPNLSLPPCFWLQKKNNGYLAPDHGTNAAAPRSLPPAPCRAMPPAGATGASRRAISAGPCAMAKSVK